VLGDLANGRLCELSHRAQMARPHSAAQQAQVSVVAEPASQEDPGKFAEVPPASCHV